LQLVGGQEDLERAKSENRALSDRLQSSHCDVAKLQQQVRELELKLSTTQDKHRTSQQQVKSEFCPWVGLTRGLGWVGSGMGRKFVF